MSELGKLVPSEKDDLTSLSGHIQTLWRRLIVSIEGDPSLCDQQRPSHRIIMRASDGSNVEIGAAWLKTAQSGPERGRRFFSIQISHPELPQLNVAAFLDDKTGDWIVVWRRRKTPTVSTA